MATYSKKISAQGYCPVDKSTIKIPIEYISLPWSDEHGERTFIRNNNLCRYLSEGRCSAGRACELYKQAPEEYKERIGKQE